MFSGGINRYQLHEMGHRGSKEGEATLKNNSVLIISFFS